jgi:hypothetical protein
VLKTIVNPKHRDAKATIANAFLQATSGLAASANRGSESPVDA